MSARVFWIFLVIVVFGAAVFVLSGRPVRVATVEIRAGSAAEIVYATGVVEPVRWSEVAPLLRARIVETCRCEAETVEEGRLLFRLDDSEARAHLAELDAKLELARTQLTRAEDLLERRVGTVEAYDEAAARVAELEASRAAQAENLNTYISRAPLTGQVLRLDGEVGEVATPGEPLAWVGQPSPKHVVAEVNEEDVPRIRVGQKALIKADAYPNADLRAEVSSITPKGDPLLKTYRVRLGLPDDTPLFIGMTVETNIIINEAPDALLVPTAAIQQEPDGAAVWVVERGVVRRAPVTLGLIAADVAQIVEGPDLGAEVVSPLVDGLQDGDRVRVLEASK